MSVVIHTERCTGCRSCEIACSYHHKKVFSRSLSSIEIIRHEKEGKFEMLLHQRRKNGHIPCDRCGFCLKYCPEVARDELRAVIAGEAMEKEETSE
jgi:Fe-S-cluster-containing dehydrogenase component